MESINKKQSVILFFGDIIVFFATLWLTLFVRYGELPDSSVLQVHLFPFSLLFVVWIGIFFIAGLYEKQTVGIQSRLPAVLFNAQLINSAIAITFFYLIPFFGIAPKVNLFIYLIISLVLLFIWRTYVARLFGSGRRRNAVFIGSGEELRELVEEIHNNKRYGIDAASVIDLEAIQLEKMVQELPEEIRRKKISLIIADLNDRRVEILMPYFYTLIFSNIQVANMHKVYEDIFNRVPLSLVTYEWFVENISIVSKSAYDVVKRAMDFVVAVVATPVSLVVYPFVYVAIKYDDGGPLFFIDTRVGKRGKIIHIHKFRSMTVDGQKITRAGAILRKTRIDELPQLWSVLRGDQSLIGPRPERPQYVEQYRKEIKHYDIRLLIAPGLSGWAQIYHDNHPHFAMETDATKEKLSYDLYYIKHRSLLLDVVIALKTLKILLLWKGK